MLRNTLLLLVVLVSMEHFEPASSLETGQEGTPLTSCPEGSKCQDLDKLRNRSKYVARSCKEIKDKYNEQEDGLYFLTTANGLVYQTFCDMTTDGGGWTLVVSVHENNIFGKCTVGDRWSSQQGNNADLPDGEDNWSNRNTFGSAEGATSDDLKNPGYYDIQAEDVSVWHVPNKFALETWKQAAILRYHTDNHFLSLYGGNLLELFKQYPVRYNVGWCVNRGPAVPIVYDKGNSEIVRNLYGRHSRAEFVPDFITFRPINNERAAMAICSGVKPATGCNTEHYCIGGGGHFPENSVQCGDFTSFNWDRDTGERGWSASKELTQAPKRGRDLGLQLGYYDIGAEDMSVWHVPKNTPLKNWRIAAILRYHTDNHFLRLYEGNLHQLFQQYPVKFNVGSCSERGPAFPIVYDHGDKDSTKELYGTNSRAEFVPGFITFRPINNERAAMAICSGVKPVTGCNTEHYCIGGGGYFPENSAQCGDFTAFDWDRIAGGQGWSASRDATGAAVLLFYR